MKLRLQKYIRDCTGIARRKAEEYIREGLVTVNGTRALLGQTIDTQDDRVELRGKPVLLTKQESIVLLLNKPAGYVTTRSDPQRRKTIYSLIPPSLHSLFPIGRLDYQTEGLLLLTNDGDLAYHLTHPKFEVEKEYDVHLHGELFSSQKREIEKGLTRKDITTAPCTITIRKFSKTETFLSITLHEGQKREVRRIFTSFGLHVLSLRRIRIHHLKLGNIPQGSWKRLNEKDIMALTC